jgi:hypothetical protein
MSRPAALASGERQLRHRPTSIASDVRYGHGQTDVGAIIPELISLMAVVVIRTIDVERERKN